MSKGMRTVKPTNAWMGPRWLGLLLLLLCIAIVSCSDTKTADPQAKMLGDVDVKAIYCSNGKKSVSSIVPVSFLVPVVVDGALTLSKVCWVGVYVNLAMGDEVGPFVAGNYWTFQQSSEFPFYVDLEEGNYMVAIGITNYVGDAYNISKAEQIQGPCRTAAGGPDCDDPLPIPIVKIEYDCMSGYDIRGGPSTSANDSLFKYVIKRFTDAGRQVEFQTDQLWLPDSAFHRATALYNYVWQYWESDFWAGHKTADLYLIGIEDCVDRPNFYGIDTALAPTVGAMALSPYGGRLGDRGSECIVFKHFADSIYNVGSRQEGYDRHATHELGHAYAWLKDVATTPGLHNGGSESNCAMNDLLYNQYGEFYPGRDKFCSKCRTTIGQKIW